MLTYPQKITFGEMRASEVRSLLIYCSDYLCSQHMKPKRKTVSDAAGSAKAYGPLIDSSSWSLPPCQQHLSVRLVSSGR